MGRGTVKASKLDESDEGSGRGQRRRRGGGWWLKWSGAGILLVMALIALLGPALARPYVRSKLQATISSRLNAELRIGGLRYVFPYGLIVDDAVLVAHGPGGEDVEMLRLPRMEMELARHPFSEGPLVFRKIELKEPSIHVVRTAEGFVGKRGLVRGEVKSAAGPVRAKISDLLELRSLVMYGGRIVYEDRVSDTAPMVWKEINANLATDPAANPLYAVKFTAGSAAMAQMVVVAELNIDELVLDVRELKMNLTADSDAKESPAPAELQKLLREFEVNGAVQIAGTANIPLRQPGRSSFDLNVHLAEARARLPQSEASLEAVSADVRFSTRPILPTQELLSTAAEIKAETRPTTRPTPMDSTFPGFFVLIQNSRAQAGDGLVSIRQCGGAIDFSRSAWKVHDLDAAIVLGAERDALPRPLRSAAEQSQLAGTISVTGSGGGNLKKDASGRRDYRVDFKAQSPRMVATERRLTLTAVQCDVVARPGLVEILEDPATKRSGLYAEAYGGQIKADGKLFPGERVRYEFDVKGVNVDLGQFGEAWAKAGEKPMSVKGRAFIEARLRGESGSGRSAAEALVADGQFEVLDGDFYQLPVIARIADSVAPSRDAGTVGQAAGLFHLENQRVYLRKAAVSAPVLGLQGSGIVDFEGNLDFKVVAAPLADWKKKLQKTRIPLIGDIGAELAGGVQKLLNTATGKVLYHFKVGGTAENPSITTEPLPILKDDAVKVFTHMLKATKADRLLEQLKN